ncbi:Gfo/Idh/MocA family protein [Planctomicrobium sp. SH661]|uniref:Gfo/Idh/MocA family protein n=1 Tax=Planctomicrobium sp. SH661 TaxID=3448124 RepID=UPI003F5C69B4
MSRRHLMKLLCGLFLGTGLLNGPTAIAEDNVIRIGIIGTDTSHAPAFTQSLNAVPAKPGMEGVRVVAAFPGGSPDLPDSINLVDKYAEQVASHGVKIVGSIEELLGLVDVVILNSIDGRVHLAQAKPVIAAGKPLFIDKPMAASLKDGKEIFRLAKENNVPCFSSSSLRYTREAVKWKDQKQIYGCEACGPSFTEPHHPTQFWYGIHGVETVFTFMGAGCESVTCIRTPEQEVAIGVWPGGRIGTFRGTRLPKNEFVAMVYGSDEFVGGPLGVNYDLLLEKVVEFFKTGKAPIDPQETLEILAFMEAADRSHEQGGAPIQLKTLLDQ